MTFIDEQGHSFVNDSRFETGMNLFNSCLWYKSHDIFEEIWHETNGKERQVLQGILQVAVAQVHLENGNINGATILYGEALGRLKGYKSDDIKLDIESLCKCVTKRLKSLQTGKDLSDCSLPVLYFL